jgi:photosystem II stability/assembly factor-like uncharacterized protein
VKALTILFAPLFLFVSPLAHSQNFWLHTDFQGQTESTCIDQNDRIFAGEINQGVYRSTDAGVSWTQVNNGLTRTNISAMAAGLNGDIFAGSDRGALFRSTDGGESWHWISDTTASYVRCIVVDSIGTIFYGTGTYVGGTANLFRSTDNGVSWRALTIGVVPRSIYVLSLKSTGNIFASVDTFGVFHSTDNGITWTQSLGHVTVTALVANTDGHLFAGTLGSLVLRSTDDGGSWTAVNSGFPGQLVRSLSHDSHGHIYASVHQVTFGWGLVFRSTDDGASWADITAGTDSAAIFSIAFDSNGFAYAASDFCCAAGGVFRSVSSTIVVDNTQGKVPASLDLFQNYPNPFNPTTTIEFSLPHSAFVTLSIFNILGGEVAALCSENVQSGTHQIKWDAQGFPSGIYFYRLQVGAFTETKKLLLLR